jgi:hypothetical protein
MPKVTFEKMDARALNFPDQSFDMVVDKGTIDAMLCSTAVEKGLDNARKVLMEAVRVLRSTAPSFIVLVSHISVDSVEFSELFENCLRPALGLRPLVLWTIDVHVSSGPSVYIVSGRPRRATRSVSRGHVDSSTMSVPVKVHYY